MMRRRNFREGGQSFILIALMFLGLVAMLALVLDGGNIYTQRRVAQAAADAGALSGARFLCGDEVNYTAAENAAIVYAVDENEADSADISFFDGKIRVTTTMEFEPFFAQVVGFSTLSASATAVAGCESPSNGRILPLTWTCPPPPEGEEGEDDLCYFDFPDCDPDEDDCVPPLYIFMNWDKRECIDPPNSIGTPDYKSGDVDCDYDDDGEDDVFVGSSNRGWLNLNDGENSSDIDLRTKVQYACSGGADSIYISDHTWLPGQDGAGPPVYDAVKEFCIDKEVVIPVYDYPCGKQTTDPITDCVLSSPHPVDDYIISAGAANYFHIIGFATFTITCVHSGPDDSGEKDGLLFPDGHTETGSVCPGRNETQLQNPDQFTKSDPMTIEGYLSFEISSDVGGSDGVDTGTYVIYLLE